MNRIVGEGPDERRLEALTERLGVEDRVIFEGPRHDIGAFLNAIDCFVFPSISEGFGIAVVEAMMAGVPVITSDAGGLAEIVNSPELAGRFPLETVSTGAVHDSRDV